MTATPTGAGKGLIGVGRKHRRIKTVVVAMQYRIENKDKTKTVFLEGTLTFTDNAAFRNIVHDLARHQGDRAVIDLGGLEFLDSAGLGMLLLARDTASEHKIRLSLRAPGEQVSRMLDIARFHELIPVE